MTDERTDRDAATTDGETPGTPATPEAPDTQPADPAPETQPADPAPDELVPATPETEAHEPDAPVPAEGDVGAPEPEATGASEAPPPDAPDAPAPKPPEHETPEAEPEQEPIEQEGPRTVGRFIADALRAAGVRYAFTVPGESFLGLLEGLQAAGIRVVATRHEGAAAFMAEAHGQLTGRPAAAIGTRAVGAANLAIGIHTARQDSSPMFALVGQVEREFRGREAFQEIDQATTIGGLAAHAIELTAVADVPRMVGDAVRAVLVGRPGPAFLSLPEDILDEELPGGTQLDTARPAPIRPEAEDVRAVLHFLASAERPVILAGGGILRARTSTDLVRLAELLRVPVIAGWRRADVISNDHPLYLGMAGYGSPAAVRERLERADAVLVIGCRLSEITSFGYAVPAEGQPWMHVDVEPIDNRPGLPAPRRTVRSDARAFLRAAVSRLQEAVLDAASADAREAVNATDRAAWEDATTADPSPWSGPGVHPAHAVAALRRLIPDDAIVTTDAGNFGLWVARHFRFRRPGTFLGPTSGAMGYGLPAAIAAALVHRDRVVVALAGDGGFAMTMAELETAVREKVKLIAVVFDNERYGTIRMHQDERGGGAEGAIATDLGPIDFAAIARACGARGIRVETDAAFEQAIRQGLANDLPTVIQVALDRGWVTPDRSHAAGA
ncbi:MAG: thiamine pyrophosphate-dependent enzyme [Candidatus Limnocylindrales bacterium]